jgi:threonine aldolase
MAEQLIDLRSDTVTRPSAAMRRVMAEAEVGDDVFGEDPSVNRLQDQVAEMLGKEAALFVPSGTMGNQLCIKVHTRPGDEIIAEAGSHVFNYETAGAAFLSGVQVHTLAGTNGQLRAAQVAQAIRPKIYYMPRTRLVCLENTHNRAGGAVYPLPLIEEVSSLARREGVGMHLDGARIWNASEASGISPAEYARHFDSVSVCFSKGLGAPVGSAIVGTRDFIEEARHYRKIFGGGMRQAGVLAAAALYALEHNIGRLGEDHVKAAELAMALSGAPGVLIDRESVQTNILIIDVAGTGRTPDQLAAELRRRGVLMISATARALRAVTHLDVTMDQVKQAARVASDVFARGT